MPQRDVLVRALWTASVPGLLMYVWFQASGSFATGIVGVDSHAYWYALQHPGSVYTSLPGYADAYLYSPAFLQVLWPLGCLPWRAFQVAWALMQCGVLFWLLKPLGWRRGAIIALACVPELLLGNLYIFYAAALVLMVNRRSGAVALPLLTKVFPGVVGLWFLVRREWRQAAFGALFTCAVVAVSMLVDWQAWQAWFQFLLDTGHARNGISTWGRVGLALALIIWAGLSGRAWLLAPALILACPVLGGFSPGAVLTAIPRLLQWQRREVEVPSGQSASEVLPGRESLPA